MRRSKIKQLVRYRGVRFAVGFLSLAGVSLLAFKLNKGPSPPAMPPQFREGTAPFVTVFMVDGLSQSDFEHGLKQGSLPSMAGCVQRGAHVKNGIGSFPSMTGYAFYPFLTGEDAARSGILGLRWFDHTRMVGPFRNYIGRTNVEMNNDLKATPLLLFEELQPSYSSSFNSYMNRGVARQWNGSFAHVMAKFGERSRLLRLLRLARFFDEELAPDWRVVETQVVEEAIADLELQPKLQWITFTSPDGDHHVHGNDSRYTKRLRHVDAMIGRYMNATKRLGSFEDRIFFILSDHGMVPVTQHIDPRELLGKHGIRVFRGDAVELTSSELTQPRSYFADFDAVLAINGNTMGHLYFRNPKAGWSAKPSTAQLRRYPTRSGQTNTDVLQVLLAHPGIELAVTREGQEVHVQTASTRAIVSKDETGYRYQRIAGDPFGYENEETAKSLLDGRTYEREVWLQGTAQTDFPFAPVRLYDVMTQDGPGDVIITSRAGYDFAPDYEMFVGNYRGGHGGIRADQIRVPYVLCGQGVREGATLNTASAEDVGATLRELLGLPRNTTLRGQPLASALQSKVVH